MFKKNLQWYNKNDKAKGPEVLLDSKGLFNNDYMIKNVGQQKKNSLLRMKNNDTDIRSIINRDGFLDLTDYYTRNYNTPGLIVAKSKKIADEITKKAKDYCRKNNKEYIPTIYEIASNDEDITDLIDEMNSL